MTAAPAKIDRQALIKQVQTSQDAQNEWLRRQVIYNGRSDILAEVILGYEVKPFHLAMMMFQSKHRESCSLVFRGAGKTTVLTVTKAIFEVIKNPNVRILITSKTAGFAQAILREIKNHFENNEALREVFGDFVSEEKWDATEIFVKGRTNNAKEATITTIGVGGQAIGRHFDVCLGDDLVDEDNSRTPHNRETTETWYYKVLHPTLEPHAQLHIIGTRYHFDDLYGHLQAKDMKDSTQIIRALSDDNRSPWPAKYPPSFFLDKREKMGTIIFNSQYQCDTEAMKGDIFQYDWMKVIDLEDVPDDARGYAGIDLAIKESETSDYFAMAGIRVKGPDIYIVNLFKGHLSFSKQTDRIIQWWRSGMGGTCPAKRMVRMGIEINAYQEAQYQRLKELEPDIVLKPINTSKDKVTRAWKLSARFEEGRVHIVKGIHNEIVENLVLLPGGKGWDIFDAIDHAVDAAFKKRMKRSRSSEPYII